MFEIVGAGPAGLSAALAARARGARLWPIILLNLAPPLSSLAASRAAFFVGTSL